MRRFAPTLVLAFLALAAAAPARAQGGWNDPRALALIRGAQQQRATTQADTGLVDYQADARGYVYFYLDRNETDERTLVKTDQVALDVFWKSPNLSKQRIIGLRDEKKLPTTIRYHQDHLAVVQDNFGDLIRIGDGDEVRDVLHPASAYAESSYDYRLADSSSIRLPGAGGAVEVYEVQVRPRTTNHPAFVGSVFVDRRQGAIVRMSFTFTAASYVDRQLDYINVLLENGLWKGRFWLPDHQQVEIRRQLPELGFPAGGVIRGTMRITHYRFNQGLPNSLFAGPKVVSVPEAQRRAFAFEEPLYGELREQGLGPTVELGEVRRMAAEIVRKRLLSGLPAARLDVPAVSSIFRYDRAEGPVAGFGTVLHPREQVQVRLNGGWAFGPMRPVATARAVYTRPGFHLEGDGYLNLPRDLQPGPNASGAMNTLTALLAGRDYTDLYDARGAELRGSRTTAGAWTETLGVRYEDQLSASKEAGFSVFGGSDPFRPVAAIDDGRMLRGSLTLAHATPAGTAHGFSASFTAAGGHLSADDGRGLSFFRPTAELGMARRWTRRDASVETRLSGGAAFGDVPFQESFLLGGRGTVPGFDYRSFGGRRFALLRATGAADVARPWIRGRLLASAGWAGDGDAIRIDGASAPLPPVLRATLHPRVSVGAGVGLIYDILRVDVHHGIGPGARWEWVVEANPTFWDFL
ncbi:MAG: hypothetical protein JWM27_2975 [Gemmatimonadetes bacterium]|nr:hypothetical protein [Gemmatimonadota bacterium]